MNKLYMISLGGKIAGANIEVHDVQFVIAPSIEAAMPLVKGHWYGNGLKLHMDSYVTINGADGYEISLSKDEVTNGQKLYFVYLGGYNKTATQEIHDVRLMVGGSSQEVKSLAIKTQGFDYIQRHVDSVVDVEKHLLTESGDTYYLKLTPAEEVYDLKPDWFGYRRLDQA